MDTPAPIRIGMGQMLVEGGRPEANLDRAVRMVRQAADEKCDIVVLPETLDLGWTHDSAATMAEPIPGPRSDRLAEAAAETGLYVAAGLTEQGGRTVYNAAVLIGPDGQLLRVHRKINELEIGFHLYSIGDSLAVVRTPLGVIGLTICADNFPGTLTLAHSLCRMGAQLILSPSAWAVPADFDPDSMPYCVNWRKSYTTLSTLYDVTVVGVSNVGRVDCGPWKGYRCIGSSLAFGPGGKELVQGPYGEDAEALLVIETTLKPPIGKGTQMMYQLKERGYEPD